MSVPPNAAPDYVRNQLLRQLRLGDLELLLPRLEKVTLDLKQVIQQAGGVSQVVVETGLVPRRLELEITETLPLLNNDRNLAMLRRLRSLGVRMVLDDFGTGYSSLAYLSTFRFDSLKLDRSLVAGMKRRDGLSIARAIIKLAADLGIAVTAEGIETARQLQQVIGEGCTQAQGYHIGRPMDPRFAPAALSRIATRLQRAGPP